MKRPLQSVWSWLARSTADRSGNRSSQGRRGGVERRPALACLEDRFTPAGPVLLADINPTGASTPVEFTAAGAWTYFVADDGVHGAELWKTDGTAAGTGLVKDIQPNSLGTPIQRLTAVGATVFFNANDGTHGWELWKSDGTADGTFIVKDIDPGSQDGVANQQTTWLTELHGALYFAADDGVHGLGLWTSDGTAGGTVRLTDIQAGSASAGAWGPLNLVPAPGGGFLFDADDGVHGYELWKSDGTAAGTAMLKDIVPGTRGSSPASLTDLNGVTYFEANNELWRTNGTAAGTVPVWTTAPSDTGEDPSDLTVVNGALYYRAGDAPHGRELWRSDGTAAGTGIVADLNPGAADSYPTRLVALGEKLMFGADDGVHGWELWSSAGTSGTTALVADIDPGAAGSGPDLPTIVNGYLCFEAHDGTHGFELWQSDGTTAGTGMVADINAAGNGLGAWSFGSTGPSLLFPATDGALGYELWTYNPGPLDDRGGGGSGGPTATIINGDLIVRGTTGNDVLSVKVRTADGQVEVTSGRNSLGAFALSAITGKVAIDGLDGNDRLVVSPNVPRPSDLTGGSGNDTLTGGSADDTLTGGLGNDKLAGGRGDDTYAFADGWGRDTVVESGVGSDCLDYAAVTADLTCGESGTARTVDLANSVAVRGHVEALISGTGQDLLTASGSTTWVLTAPNAGTVDGLAFRGVESFTGGPGRDALVVKPGGTLAGWFDGGKGRNRLDYAALTTAIVVDLRAGSASGLAGVRNAADVMGGLGNDLIVGNDDANSLVGGGGNDVLVGNGGGDALAGNDGDDLLVAGIAAVTVDLTAVRAEWTSNDSYGDRLSRLLEGGGANGATVLSTVTVADDAQVDRLSGGVGADWFLTGRKDKAGLIEFGEIITTL
jgi:ELWxxDGT repeat protein